MITSELIQRARNILNKFAARYADAEHANADQKEARLVIEACDEWLGGGIEFQLTVREEIMRHPARAKAFIQSLGLELVAAQPPQQEKCPVCGSERHFDCGGVPEHLRSPLPAQSQETEKDRIEAQSPT